LIQKKQYDGNAILGNRYQTEQSLEQNDDKSKWLRARGRCSIRTILKSFAAESAPHNSLFWDSRIDNEDGSGIRIALLDSGIDWSHPAFAQANLIGKDFTGSHSLFDATGHGTANASLLVGRSKKGALGLCYASALMVAKVLGGPNRKRTEKAIAAAIHWSVRGGADVIILPFGTCRNASVIDRAIRIAVKQGCRLFAAAGNRGPDKICFPAWLPMVTSVSALANDGSIYPYCSAQGNVDLFAWGDGVPVVGLDRAIEVSGSSPATVLAAGCAALKLSAKKKNA
jgi:subtilisin family serine protease